MKLWRSNLTAKMAFEQPSKKLPLTRLFISPERQVTIPWLRSTLNTLLEDPHLGRPVIGYIKRTHIENTFDQPVYVAEVLCGSDNLDELLEHIQKSYMWVINLSQTNKADVWEMFEGLGNNLKYYEEERDIHRKKLMRKWDKLEPTDAGRPWVKWSKEEESAYQERVRLMKITSEKAGLFEPIDPAHFTEHTKIFLGNLAANFPPASFFSKLAEDQADETAYFLSHASFVSKNQKSICQFRSACGSSWAATFDWADVSVIQKEIYPWTISKEELAIYREILQKKIIKAAAEFI